MHQPKASGMSYIGFKNISLKIAVCLNETFNNKNNKTEYNLGLKLNEACKS
jgi:hypothetical protein